MTNMHDPRDYHVSVGAHFRKGGAFGRVEKLLVLLIESGFVYCILWVIAICPPFDGSEQYTKWRSLQTLYLLHAFGVLVVSTSSIFPIVMLYISVRIWKEFVQVLNRPIFCFQSTYPLIINVLAITTQSGESSGVWVQSVR